MRYEQVYPVPWVFVFCLAVLWGQTDADLRVQDPPQVALARHVVHVVREFVSVDEDRVLWLQAEPVIVLDPDMVSTRVRDLLEGLHLFFCERWRRRVDLQREPRVIRHCTDPLLAEILEEPTVQSGSWVGLRQTLLEQELRLFCQVVRIGFKVEELGKFSAHLPIVAQQVRRSTVRPKCTPSGYLEGCGVVVHGERS